MYRLFAARSLQARQPRFVFTELAREELVVHLAGRPTSVAADGSISGREASRPTHSITLGTLSWLGANSRRSRPATTTREHL